MDSVHLILALSSFNYNSIEHSDMMQKFQGEYQRAQCIALGKAGMTYRKISTIVNMFKSSVQRA
ncbi:unnamed protein product, partial [Rotaria sp. Silwood1]